MDDESTQPPLGDDASDDESTQPPITEMLDTAQVDHPTLSIWVRIRPGDDPRGDFVECAEAVMDPETSLRVGAVKRDVPRSRLLTIADGHMAVGYKTADRLNTVAGDHVRLSFANGGVTCVAENALGSTSITRDEGDPEPIPFSTSVTINNGDVVTIGEHPGGDKNVADIRFAGLPQAALTTVVAGLSPVPECAATQAATPAAAQAAAGLSTTPAVPVSEMSAAAAAAAVPTMAVAVAAAAVPMTAAAAAAPVASTPIANVMCLTNTIVIPDHLGEVPPKPRLVCAWHPNSNQITIVGTAVNDDNRTPEPCRCVIPANVQQVGRLHLTLSRSSKGVTAKVHGKKGARAYQADAVEGRTLAANTTIELGDGDRLEIGPPTGRRSVLSISAAPPTGTAPTNPAAVRAVLLAAPRSGEDEVSAQKRRRYDDRESKQVNKVLAKQQERLEQGARLLAELQGRDVPPHIKKGAGRQITGATISSIKNQVKRTALIQQRGNRARQTSASKVNRGLVAVAKARKVSQHQHTTHTGRKQSMDQAARSGVPGGGTICRHHLRGKCERQHAGNAQGPRCIFEHPNLNRAPAVLRNEKRAARRRSSKTSCNTAQSTRAGKRGGDGGRGNKRGGRGDGGSIRPSPRNGDNDRIVTM